MKKVLKNGHLIVTFEGKEYDYMREFFYTHEEDLKKLGLKLDFGGKETAEVIERFSEVLEAR